MILTVYRSCRTRLPHLVVASVPSMVRKNSASSDSNHYREYTGSDGTHYRDYSMGVKLPLDGDCNTDADSCLKSTKRIDWIFTVLKEKSRTLWWKWASTLTVATVGIVSRWFLYWFNKVHTHNAHILQDCFDSRPNDVPLITVSNHHSCFDDPGLWVLLKNRQLCNNERMRWSMAAHDICFTQKSHSYFFMLGKCLPVVRGAGIFQKAIDFAIAKLSRGEWVHIFPEGKVNMEQSYLRFKWGIARLVLESPVTPIVVPIWHLGMETVLPNAPPYYLRRGKTLTFAVGEPLPLESTLRRIRASKVSEEEARIVLTRVIQDALYKLKDKTEKIHSDHLREDQTGS